LLARFRDHTVKLLTGMDSKASLTGRPSTKPQKENTLIYILQHPAVKRQPPTEILPGRPGVEDASKKNLNEQQTDRTN